MSSRIHSYTFHREGSRDTSSAMRSSCQTRALILDARGQGTRPKRRPCRMAGGKRPVSRPAEERGLKPSLATDDRKGIGACDRDPLIQVLVQVWGRLSTCILELPWCGQFMNCPRLRLLYVYVTQARTYLYSFFLYISEKRRRTAIGSTFLYTGTIFLSQT